MPRVKLIKTLPHLQQMHIQQLNLGIYATIFTTPILEYLSGVATIKRSDISYSKLREILEHSPVFERSKHISQVGDYNLVGELIYFWPPGYDNPIRAEFFDQDLEKFSSYDTQLGRAKRELDSLIINFNRHLDESELSYLKVSDNADSTEVKPAIFLNKSPQFIKTNDFPVEIIEYDYQYPQLFWQRFDLLEKRVNDLEQNGYEVAIITKHPTDIPENLKDIVPSTSELELGAKLDIPAILQYITSNITSGVISQEQKLAIFTDREIFGTIYLTQDLEGKSTNSQKLLRQLEGEIAVGDYIVHEDYGVGIYSGLTQERIGGEMREYLEVEYANESKVLVPVDQVAKLTKFIGNDNLPPTLSKLDKGGWKRLQKQVKKTVKIKAEELVEHYARRELANAHPVDKEDSPEFNEFLADFKYEATPDQIQATNEIIHDLAQTLPMNRLLVGDVGFGKTEVAMRAAFKVVESSRQVAVLCPTTVLTAQHYEVFKRRFDNTKFKVEKVSRFKTSKMNREAIDRLNEGKIDIIIGTHRLLSNDVKFKRLGLLIVDEEQRFGVAQKEKIKQLNYGVHHLSISATPIPRTLSMALASIQDISIITQAPAGRKPIKTEIVMGDWNKIAASIQNELDRGGQLYFVHNRVATIPAIKNKLQQVMPGLKVIIAHGQMSSSDLDKAMTDFYEQQADVLLTTTIIENGLDMPNVNTIIINKADSFGLAQLYQLRGRVGRSERQAYCQLLVSDKFKQVARVGQAGSANENTSNIKKVARRKLALERLETLAQSSELGSGFSVASKDLEIRGAGDLLGKKQSGKMSKIGYSLYMQLLAQEIDRLKQAKQELDRTPEFVTI